ncbi:MAG: L-histidine N(alpha)-methyltransferase [Verrucomicrobiota bacterium]|jgi:uncharacterized SAM-dependent methyltransferase
MKLKTTVKVTVHSSQYPESVQLELARCLHARQIAPKFLYQSYKQSEKWLALHRAWSPAQTDPDCAAIYDRAFAAAGACAGRRWRLIALGCGGGQKEARLLRALVARPKELSYSPCDVSLALVLTALREASSAAPDAPCQPLLCDLARAGDLPAVFDQLDSPGVRRLFTFFGMIPNFEPDNIMPRLASLARTDDLLLFSANLAPGADYAAGMRRILPGYDNAETRDWLLTFLFDLGVEPQDGRLEFSIEQARGLKRVAADFHFRRARSVSLQGERFDFPAGKAVRLFFSYRHTPRTVSRLLRAHQFAPLGRWITRSGEEGVWLCRKSAG